jgi:hypothetical protein
MKVGFLRRILIIESRALSLDVELETKLSRLSVLGFGPVLELSNDISLCFR